MARSLARDALREWGVTAGCVDTALLVVSELVTNAVEHALPPVTLHLVQPAHDGDVLRVEVTDGGPSPRPGQWVASCSPYEHGRGRFIIEELATAHGPPTGTDSTVHWADLPLSA
ncbi:ATP-binding protein [Streptomyces sp. NPDC057910]|uniref:ATP-binding protein n=1 Tax=Streptomyces sp. NPDC057910 TaxID=3346278 RepID=UPI0036E162E3